MVDNPAPRSSLREQLRWLGLALVGVAVLGLAAGWLYAKGQPSSAAGAIIADFVDDEPPVAYDPADAAPIDVETLPSSGPHADGVVRCGFVEELRVADHLASLAAGVIVIRYRPDLPASALPDLRELAGRREVLVAPADGLENVEQAFAWGRRLRLSAHNREFLRAFHTAHVDGLVPDAVDLPATCNGA